MLLKRNCIRTSSFMPWNLLSRRWFTIAIQTLKSRQYDNEICFPSQNGQMSYTFLPVFSASSSAAGFASAFSSLFTAPDCFVSPAASLCPGTPPVFSSFCFFNGGWLFCPKSNQWVVYLHYYLL